MKSKLPERYFSLNELRILKNLVFLFLLSCGCSSNPESRKLITDNQIIRAKRFSIEEQDGITILTINNPWQGAEGISTQFRLVKKGGILPHGFDSSGVIFVPVKRIITMSTTHVAMISALGESGSIVGVSGKGYIYSDSVRQMIKKFQIPDVGYESNINNELIYSLYPDLLMMYGVGSESLGYTSKITEMGVKVLFNADYLEEDPLGKAEWIKLFGALYCKEELADSIFAAELTEYERIRSIIADRAQSQPKVLLGLPFKDTWYISPGNSFISKLITDAGGEYLWKDSESSFSMPLGIEYVYMKALDADFWLNTGTATSESEILAVDPRLADLKCFRNNKIFNNNKRITDRGGNDYWEGGSLYPHLILYDIASILHPEILVSDNLHFYRKLNE